MSRFSTITLIDSPHYNDHDTGGGEHPEIPARSQIIRKRLTEGPLAPHIKVMPPKPATRQWLTGIHSEDYLFRFEEAVLAGQTYLGHPDNQICFDSYDIALLAAGAGFCAIDLIEEHQALPFCSVRPPGHHAEKSMALGFCFLNNVALAANYWHKNYNRQKIFIIDFDAHHGNGIQAAFEENPDIFYASLHEHPSYSFPGTGYAEETGKGAGQGGTLNIPLPPGTGDETALREMDKKIGAAIDKFKPEAIIVAAGFDAHSLDDMSGLNYSTLVYSKFGARIRNWADKFCQGRVLSILEGGYHLESLAAGVEAYLAGLALQE